MFRIPYFLLACSSLSLISPAFSQDAPRLTARELFYAAAQQPSKPAAKAAPKKKPSPVARAAAPKQAPPVETARNESAPPAQPAETSAALPEGAHIVRTAATTAPAPSSGTALGLRYTIRKRIDGQMVEVAPDTVFHAGDSIQLDIQSNSAGYLYIVNKGTSGQWNPLFPSKEVADGNNHIEGFRTYIMPPGAHIGFDDQAGEEKLFIVLSRTPEPDLENLVYSLQKPKSKPAAEPAAPAPQPKALVADFHVNDSMVGLLRTTYARDLIIEKASDDASAPAKEKSVYVVNPSGSADSRVVADIVLVHR